MLKQGRIELDRREIQSIHQKRLEQKRQQQQRGDCGQAKKQLRSQLVTAQIFPREFIPFFIDEYSKESVMKLYRFNRGTFDLQLACQRIKVLYETINCFKSANQRQKLAHMLRLDQINALVTQINNAQQSQEQILFLPYLEEGQILDKVQIWRFKHETQNSAINYDDRQILFKDYQLLLRLVDKLQNHQQFHSIVLSSSSLLMLQYPKCSLQDNEYQLRLQCRQVFDLTMKCQSNLKIKQFDLIHNARKILLKLLGISQDKSSRSQLDQHHYQKIQYLLNLQDIINLNYQDFYYLKKSNLNTQKQTDLSSNQQQLQKLKQDILSLQQLAKTQLKDFKLQSPQPKLTQTTKQNNKQFWSSIEKYILSNITQSERKTFLNPVQKKPPTQSQSGTVKRPQRKPSATNVKKQTKPEPKQVSKIQQKQQAVNPKSIQLKQLIVQANYIASGSDLKFRPQLLLQSVETKQSLLYILKTRSKQSFQAVNHIACYINAKPLKQTFNLFGSYSPDAQKKSFIYSERTDRFYKLIEKSCAVGYGPQVFFSVGKLDIIVPCFGTEHIDGKEWLKCISYFPVSYSEKGVEMNGMDKIQDQEENSKVIDNKETKENELGLERQFLLEDVDIYEIKVKGQ